MVAGETGLIERFTRCEYGVRILCQRGLVSALSVPGLEQASPIGRFWNRLAIFVVASTFPRANLRPQTLVHNITRSFATKRMSTLISAIGSNELV